jgi:DNA-binding CsgD family transcriptional regulator
LHAERRARLVSLGHFNEVTVARLCLSPETVGSNVGHVYTQLRSSRAAAALHAMRHGDVGVQRPAVREWRRHTLPPWAVLLAGVGGIFAIVLAEIGTTVLIYRSTRPDLILPAIAHRSASTDPAFGGRWPPPSSSRDCGSSSRARRCLA